MEAYIKNQFTFVGVPSKLRKEVLKRHIRIQGIPKDEQFEIEIKALWKLKIRELNYCAQELMNQKKWFRQKDSIH
ncbi:DNA alkylation repair protein [Salibacteraceae bacterium]|jgi:3-methyladenine DNA glycosylase AlkD|nr:DNA alkylation repair protein [Salibacteraceae bacterium]